ncbi:MAG: histidine kinase N-terminal 7TM domain-containing protein [Chloroflexota bacterium]
MLPPIYIVPFGISALILFILGFYSLRFYRLRSSLIFALGLFLCGFWTVFTGLTLSSENLSDKILWSNLGYTFGPFIPVVWLSIALNLVGQDRWFRWWWMVLLYIVPSITVLLAWTSGQHKFFLYSSRLEISGSLITMLSDRGPWYWVHIGFTYIVFLICILILAFFAFWNRTNIYARQATMVFIGLLFPIIFNIFYLLKLTPLPGYNLGPPMCVVMGLLTSWALFKYRLLDLIPIGRGILVDHMHDLLLVLDAQEQLVDFNPAAQEVFEFKPKQDIGKPLTLVLERWPELVASYQDGSQGNHEIYLDKAKHHRIFEVSVSPINSKHKKLLGSIILLHDITRRKEAEQALEAERERLIITLHSSGEAIITTDQEGQVDLINQVAEGLTGWNQQEARTLPLTALFRLIHPNTREPLPNPFTGLNSNLPRVSNTEDIILIRQDGSECYINYTISLILDRGGERVGMVLVVQDVTEKRRIAEERLKAHNLESLGILAGGIAHDFNNILTGIMGNLMLTKMRLPPTDEATVSLENAEKATLQAKVLTGHLLTFSSGGAPIKQVVRLEDLIRDTVSFVLHGSNVRGEFDVPETLWTAEVDQVQIKQVLQSLLLNALQAMPAGGKITLSANNLQLTEEVVALLEPGRYVRLVIQDEGYGIKAEDLPRIFDPYFTTKAGKSGLGLSICYSIIRQHKGQILLDSEPGKGTTVTLYLLASEREVELVPERPRVAIPVGTSNTSRKILIMDDEAMILQVTSKLLQKRGYKVATAQDGAVAIAQYQKALEEREPFSLVIMDLTIPGGMGGKEAVQKVLEIDSQARVIVSSGYSSDPVMANYQEYGFVGMLSKPYTLASLEQVIFQVTSTHLTLESQTR